MILLDGDRCSMNVSTLMLIMLVVLLSEILLHSSCSERVQNFLEVERSATFIWVASLLVSCLGAVLVVPVCCVGLRFFCVIFEAGMRCLLAFRFGFQTEYISISRLKILYICHNTYVNRLILVQIRDSYLMTHSQWCVFPFSVLNHSLQSPW
jgi:hypothetical protein